jgi:hypothetical protein
VKVSLLQANIIHSPKKADLKLEVSPPPLLEVGTISTPVGEFRIIVSNSLYLYNFHGKTFAVDLSRVSTISGSDTIVFEGGYTDQISYELTVRPLCQL